MYINPFVAGVLATLVSEFILFVVLPIIYACFVYKREKNNDTKRDI